MTYLVKVLEQCLKEKYDESDFKLRDKVVVPVLKAFISLCPTTEFHWHLTKHNALDLLKDMRVHTDSEIN
jgi:predicted secreted protein